MDKNKIIEGAAKLVAKGAYDKAIKEYQRVLETDPKDVRVLQKMGELYQKKNDTAQAAHYFTKVAENYAQDGFFLKAVALYKQVLKLNPGLMEVNLKLAELHVQLQLLSEATAYYQLLANHYDKQGNPKASLGILKKMVDLDPDNVASRIKVAELYTRENMNAEAATEFRHAADYLKRNNRQEDYLRVAERLASVDPSDLGLARELALSYVQRQDHKRALARLQILFKADPRDEQTLTLLAEAFSGLGQTQKTISVYKELAKVVSEKGRSEDAERFWSKVEQLDPKDPDLKIRPPSGRAPAPVSTAAPIPSVQPAVRAGNPSPAADKQSELGAAPVFTTSGGTASPLPKLLNETDVYVKYGLHDKALEHLKRIFMVDPENLDAHEKAYQVYLSAKNQAQAAEQLLNVLRLCARQKAVARAQPYLTALLQQNPNHPEVPAFLSVLRANAEEEEIVDEPILVEPVDEEIVVGDAPEDALLGPATDEFNLEPGSSDGEELVVEEAALEDDFSIPTTDEVPWPQGDPEPLNSGLEPEPTEERTIVGMNPLDFPANRPSKAPSASKPIEESPYELSMEESFGEEVAVDEESFELDPEPEPQLEEASVQPLPSDPVEFDAELEAHAEDLPPEPLTAVPGPGPAFPAEDPAAAECDEASFFLEQGLKEEALEVLQTVLLAWPGHPRATELMTQLESLHDAEPTSFDLAAEVAEELGGAVEEEAPAPAPQVDDFQVSMEEVLSEFKKGLEKVVKPEDVETHYDLGIAYKEMGLLDDALNEFQVAKQGCTGKRKEVDCLSMRALLFTLKADHASAVASLKEALALPFATEGDTQKALLYDLAAAWKATGAQGKALFLLQKIQALDGSYRDISSQIAELQLARITPEDDAAPAAAGALPPKSPAARARKVGYL